jgi:hypothetical protein
MWDEEESVLETGHGPCLYKTMGGREETSGGQLQGSNHYPIVDVQTSLTRDRDKEVVSPALAVHLFCPVIADHAHGGFLLSSWLPQPPVLGSSLHPN